MIDFFLQGCEIFSLMRKIYQNKKMGYVAKIDIKSPISVDFVFWHKDCLKSFVSAWCRHK